MLNGWKMMVDTTQFRLVDVFDAAAQADKLVQDALYSVNELREKFEDDPIPERWASEYNRTKKHGKYSRRLRHRKEVRSKKMRIGMEAVMQAGTTGKAFNFFGWWTLSPPTKKRGTGTPARKPPWKARQASATSSIT